MAKETFLLFMPQNNNTDSKNKSCSIATAPYFSVCYMLSFVLNKSLPITRRNLFPSYAGLLAHESSFCPNLPRLLPSGAYLQIHAMAELLVYSGGTAQDFHLFPSQRFILITHRCKKSLQSKFFYLSAIRRTEHKMFYSIVLILSFADI